MTVPSPPAASPAEIIGGGRLARLLARYYLAPDHPAKLRVWGWLYRLFGRPMVVVQYAGRAALRLDYQDYVQGHILTTGFYEPEVWDSLAAVAAGDEVVWDIGGHVGSVAIRAALDPRVRAVHTFEPNPPTAAALLGNLALNPALPVLFHPFALGDRDENRRLSPGTSGNIGMASLVADPAADGVAVRCTTADALIAAGVVPPPTLIKLDVEGFEAAALSGARNLLASGRVKAIAFEAEADVAGRLIDHEVSELLTASGYQYTHIPRPDGTIVPRENFLATRTPKSTA